MTLTKEGQLLAFFAGANSIFIGEKLLTTSNIALDRDNAMLTEIR
jgi:biotin synthase